MGAQPTSPSTSGPASEPKKLSWVDKFLSKIGDQIQDLTNVEIITAAAGTASIKIDSTKEILDELTKAKAQVLARTRIELDGDIVMLLPTDPQSGAKINKDIMDIHKETTAVAVENWKSFLNMIVSLIDTVVKITHLSESDVLEKFSIEPPPAT
jgi:hypothetical protein